METEETALKDIKLTGGRSLDMFTIRAKVFVNIINIPFGHVDTDVMEPQGAAIALYPIGLDNFHARTGGNDGDTTVAHGAAIDGSIDFIWYHTGLRIFRSHCEKIRI